MSNDNNDSLVSAVPSFVSRVMANEATRKGLAAAGAGLLVAVVTEVFWPSR